ncbi:MAG: hypothetical protein KKD17_01200 [Nanoarchaeota archaeon]|nr:hypothetical protein [Nanoarchaeota archaeon]
MIFDYFSKKLRTYSNDVVFLYTNGIYFNTMGVSFQERKKTNQQMINHSVALRKLIDKRKQFIPNAFHYLPIDYVLLNSKHFAGFFSKLKNLEKRDPNFRKHVKRDMGERQYNEANVNFILEEVAVAHILRQRLVDLPRTLVKNDLWRLIVYSGGYMHADFYQWKKKILPQVDTINPYKGGQYDFHQKKMFVFDDMKIK